MVKPSGFIKCGDDIVLLNELVFAGKSVPAGTHAKVDKYDPSRE
jgi:hypothetical protein